ncbi:MAG: UDP-N-acetylmuramate dehydrogenase [Deltaproteobacteria bacterium]|nr:UDP-N-acetylmuramate dehydrogenase [Deltaproteobacteria bacterium]
MDNSSAAVKLYGYLLAKGLGNPRKVVLSKLSTIRIGGEAILAQAGSIKELEKIIQAAQSHACRAVIVGGGSNTLYPDTCLKALAISLTGELAQIEIKTEAGLDENQVLVKVGAGLGLGRLLQEAANEGLSGLEFLAGIPGTVGGAVCGNAGAAGGSISDKIESIFLHEYCEGEKEIFKGDFQPGYRTMGLDLKDGEIVITAVTFKLEKKDPQAVRSAMAERIRERSLCQPKEPSLGCFFLNPKGISAGMLIDQCHLKDLAYERALISNLHANFIINNSNAKAFDVCELANIVRSLVYKHHKIILEPEVKIWDDYGRDIGLKTFQIVT